MPEHIEVKLDFIPLGSWFDASNHATRPVLLSVTHWAEIP